MYCVNENEDANHVIGFYKSRICYIVKVAFLLALSILYKILQIQPILFARKTQLLQYYLP